MKSNAILIVLVSVLLLCILATNLFKWKDHFYMQKRKLSEGFVSEEVYYIYWTGGFDSTYRLCEMLVVEKKESTAYLCKFSAR